MHSVRNLLIQWANQQSIGHPENRTYAELIKDLKPAALTRDQYTEDGCIDKYTNKKVMIFLSAKEDKVGHLVFGSIQIQDQNGAKYHTPQFIGIDSDDTPFRRCIFRCSECRSCNYINDILQYAIFFNIIT